MPRRALQLHLRIFISQPVSQALCDSLFSFTAYARTPVHTVNSYHACSLRCKQGCQEYRAPLGIWVLLLHLHPLVIASSTAASLSGNLHNHILTEGDVFVSIAVLNSRAKPDILTSRSRPVTGSMRYTHLLTCMSTTHDIISAQRCYLIQAYVNISSYVWCIYQDINGMWQYQSLWKLSSLLHALQSVMSRKYCPDGAP